MAHKNPISRAEYQRNYWIKNKDVKSIKGKMYWLKSKYGITPEEHKQLLISQDYKCALCGRPSSDFKYELAVDHCHETGRIRGMLCMPCNTSLGQLGDDVESMYKIIDYLNKTQNTGI